jgi:hypothetical protein
LGQFEAWAESSDLSLTADEQAYLDASLAEREAKAALKEIRKAHEAQLQQRAASRLRYLVTTLALFLIVSVGLTTAALRQTQVAQLEAGYRATQAAIAEHNAAEAQSLPVGKRRTAGAQ